MFGNGIVGNVLDNSHGDLGRNALPAGMNRSNRSDDFFPQHAFQEIACGPRPLSPQRLNIALVCRQDRESGSREFSADREDGIDTVHYGHLQVH
jgi:hypothetical protein